MNTIGKEVIVEQEINKSSFITYLKLVTTPTEAKEYTGQELTKDKLNIVCGSFYMINKLKKTRI